MDIINYIPSWFAGTSFESIDLNATSDVPWNMSTIGPEINIITNNISFVI